MKRPLVITLATLVAVAIVVAVLGIKRVPDDHEALRVSRGGDLDVYTSGIRFVAPGYADYLLYPVGAFTHRYPKQGTTPVLTAEGDPVRVAFEFRVFVPPGGSKQLYEGFSESFDEAVGRLILEAAEIEGARVSRSGDRDSYAEAVANGVRAELARVGASVVDCKLISWEGAAPAIETSGGALDKPLRKLIVVGVDGGDWVNIKPLVEAGKLPNFKRLMEGGAWGALRTIEPMLSPLLWTSIATGKYPEDHGILNFTIVDEKTKTKVPITRHYRKADAFWNMVGDYGRTVAVTGWLATHPAEAVNGVMVTDKVGYLAYAPEDREKEPGGGVFPKDRAEEISGFVQSGSSVPFAECDAFLNIGREEFEKHRTIEFDPKDSINTFILLYASTKTFHNIALHLLEKDRPDVLAVYFEWVDAVSHLFILHAPPKLPDVDEVEYNKFKDAVNEAYVYQDALLGEYIDRLDEETVLLVISDHGFKAGDSRLKNRPEIWAGNAAVWHRLDGIIALYGNGIKKGYQIREASILDVTPTILALQGLPRASDMPGKVLALAFETPLRKALKPNMVATLERDREDDVVGPEPAEGAAAEETMKKLEALGYLTPDNADAHNNLGQRYQERGDYLKAIEEYKKALALRPRFHSVYNNIAVCYGKLKRHREAEEALLKAIEIKPDDFYAMNNLAITYAETGRMDEARGMAQRAVKTEPGYVNGHVTLGSVYAMTGQLEAAEREFEAALALEPNDPKAKENLRRVRLQRQGSQSGQNE